MRRSATSISLRAFATRPQNIFAFLQARSEAATDLWSTATSHAGPVLRWPRVPTALQKTGHVRDSLPKVQREQTRPADRVQVLVETHGRFSDTIRHASRRRSPFTRVVPGNFTRYPWISRVLARPRAVLRSPIGLGPNCEFLRMLTACTQRQTKLSAN